jgi:hypothetical protein
LNFNEASCFGSDPYKFLGVCLRQKLMANSAIQREGFLNKQS